MIFTNNTDSLTFHVRITKKCNADCSYCSSFEAHAKDLMPIEDVEKSIKFIANIITKHNFGGTRKSITVQYIGGELLTVPIKYLTDFTKIVEKELSPLFLNFRQGCQSNLIGSQKRVSDLLYLFDGNIGTSLDTETKQRTILNSNVAYNKIFFKNLKYSKKMTGKNLSSIVVIDKEMIPNIKNQISFAEKEKIHITLRPVFNGGMPIEHVDGNDLNHLYTDLFNDWFMKSNIAIEPFFSLLDKRILKYNKDNIIQSISGCPFQHNCSTSSINMEPDGTLYTCLDMADSNHYPIGNALKEELNIDTFKLLSERHNKLNSDCIKCDYFNECQGGCMNEAIEHKSDVFGKTEYCSTWKVLFKLIDEGILTYGVNDVSLWINKLKKSF